MSDLTDLFNSLLNGAPITDQSVHQAAWAVLLASLVVATIHFVTMMVTRWGDRNATTKSLIFSIAVHLCCGFGVVALPIQLSSSEEPAPEPPPADPIEVTELVWDATEDNPAETGGNTPIWEQPPEQSDVEPQRTQQDNHTPTPPEDPERMVKDSELPRPQLDQDPAMEEETFDAPETREFSDAGPQPIDARPLDVDDFQPEARPDLEAPTAKFQRSRPARRLTDNTDVQRSTKRGDGRRFSDTARRDMSIPTDLNQSEEPDLRAGTDDDSQQSTSPSVVQIPIDDEGLPGSEPGAGATSKGPKPAFTRRSPIRRRSSSENSDTRSANSADRRVARTRTNLTDLPGRELDDELPRPKLRSPSDDPVARQGATKLPATYQLRNLDTRSAMARKFGGTRESEEAVELSLRWLVNHQNPEGFWDANGFGAHCPAGDRCRGLSGRVHQDEHGIDRRQAGLHADAGLTGLAILAFLGAGYTHETGPYADNVDRALRWLVRIQDDRGYLGGRATHYAKMYCHAMATYAMAEAYAMQDTPRIDTSLRAPLQKAVAFILNHQSVRDGGWRYLKGQRSDMSMFGWQLMAIKSAELAGLQIPSRNISLMRKFLTDRSLGEHGGLAAYRVVDPPLPPSASMSAEALFCKQIMGLPRNHPASREAVSFLMQNRPRLSKLDLYYWYYGTLAMYQFGGAEWESWNERVRDILVDEQVKSGHAAGSWNPYGPWGAYGGRIYSTVMSTLCLEVYYRFLPLYNVGQPDLELSAE